MKNMAQNSFIKRHVTPVLKKMVQESPVTVLTGMRQVGKSTLLQHEFAQDWAYLSFDDLDAVRQIKQDPEVLLNTADRMILDEAQKVPEIFSVLKRIVDRNTAKRFIVSGSANILLMSRVTESLAGRAEFVDLYPMTASELGESKPRIEMKTLFDMKGLSAGQTVEKTGGLENALWRGGMPVVLQRKSEDGLVRWREGYITSYLERDLRQLAQIDQLADFKKLMQILALRNGRILNQSEIARDAGLSQPTAHRYINLLETTGHIYRLPAYRTNRTAQLIKSPKLIWTDSGLAAHIAGYYSPSALKTGREWGAFFESYVISQLKFVLGLMTPVPRIFYWRTRSNIEVDLVIEYGNRLVPVEIKASGQAGLNDTEGLQAFMQLFPEVSHGIVLYAGDRIVQLGHHLTAVPFGALV